MKPTTYEAFLQAKTQGGADSGFKPVWMPDFLFDFQASNTEWAIRKGRAANIADCGLGKTPMGLVWGSNMVRKKRKPVLYLTPVAVGPQTIREAEKFGIQASGRKAYLPAWSPIWRHRSAANAIQLEWSTDFTASSEYIA